jgi:hypothetical protein
VALFSSLPINASHTFIFIINLQESDSTSATILVMRNFRLIAAAKMPLTLDGDE